MAGAVAAPAVAAAEPAGTPTIDWGPCADPDVTGVECATIEVPLDYARPHGEKIEIGLARRPATDPAKRIGSIVVDPGGPGGSGVAQVMYGDPVFPAEVNARFDQIGFDPRGINTSTKLLCDVELFQQARDARRPANQAEFDQLAALNRALHDSCRENSGELANHVDNLHTARDLDAVRAALGDRKLTFVGYSYGSLMGQQYAELFPHRVRALVLDGNMDHSLTNAWEFARSETAPVEQAFVEFANWCETTATCPLYGQDVEAVYADLKARAKAGTLLGPEGQPMSFYELSGLAFGTATPEVWTQIAEEMALLRDGTGTSASLASFTAFEEVGNVPYPPIWCSDWRYPVRSHAEYAGIRARLADRFPNVEWTPYVDHMMTCVNSGTKTTNPQRPLRIHGAPPLVMIGNVHDPATVYEWNVAAARQSGARLITYEGWGHTIYGNGQSECVDDAVNDYLVDLRPPERGLSCPATEQPGLARIATSTRPTFPDGRF